MFVLLKGNIVMSSYTNLESLGCKTIRVPLNPCLKINIDEIDKNDDLLTNITDFQKLIGKLIYLTITKLGISYFMPTLNQFMHSPNEVSPVNCI